MLKRTIYFSKPARLSLKDQQVVYKLAEGDIRTLPIEDIGFVVLEDQQISISLPLLNALNDNNVAVILCNDKHMPSAMLLNLDGHSVQTELFSKQITASEPLKKKIWKQTIEAKIKNQAEFLNKVGCKSDDILSLSRNVNSGDSTNREGAAARLYWSRLFGTDFVRDRYGSPPNMLLNYGYIILRASVARALTGSGLLPTLGIFHHNKYNSFCLADDIMEPYRPFVDNYVHKIYYEDQGRCIIDKDIKLRLLEVLTADVMINKKMRPLMVALSQTTASLARCFAQETRRVQYPEFP
jgi:CRISP-associated protein Cas1